MSDPSALRQERSGLVFNLAAIFMIVALLGIGIAYAIDAASRSARSAPHQQDRETTLTRTIGGKELHIPLSWFQHAEQREEGFAKQVELQIALPLGTGGAMRPVEVTLLPQSRVRPSARLLDGVYVHQFLPEQLEGPPGLVGKPLRPAEGYAAETVWYDALSPDPFVAKCSAPVVDGAESRCLRTVLLLPGLAAVYDFSAELLAEWKRFDPELRARLETIKVF